MSPKDSRNSPNHPQKSEGGNENKQRKNPIVFISLITGLIIATAIGASVITAVILKQGNLIGGNNSTASPTSMVAELPTASPTPTVAETPTASPTPTVAETPTASPTPTVAESPTASPTPIVAESPTASPSETAVSLLDMECLSSTPGVEKPFVKQREPKNIAIGGEVLPEIAYLSNRSGEPYSYIYNDESAGVSCALNSKFRQLNLVVGINGKHSYARQDHKIVFEVSLDNKVVATENLTLAAKQVLNINVQNARSVGIKATCKNAYSNYSCPYVAFVEASLR
ncbi:hypothetical protein NIES4073_10170 [Kalymmatonema gypsitolerans NIES-4073]|uniref:hypothetical protein n=1 Tax=Scytonema sp. PRP1 TaxID=3120513 RepID=UPI000B601C97|nr:hypothetical protein NIES4073_10170 [Scytonema sp. NIES-4073]